MQSKSKVALVSDSRIEALKKIKENSDRPNVEIAAEIGVRESTFSIWLRMDSLDHINPGSKKLIDLFIKENQRFLK